MVEAFTAEHNVSIREAVIDWPASKFEAFYKAFAKRKIADDLSNRRNIEMAATIGNSNYDGSKPGENPRETIMKNIDERYSTVLRKLYNVELPDEEIDYDDPFFGAMKKNMDSRGLPDPPRPEDIDQ